MARVFREILTFEQLLEENSKKSNSEKSEGKCHIRLNSCWMKIPKKIQIQKNTKGSVILESEPCRAENKFQIEEKYSKWEKAKIFQFGKCRK